MPIHIRPEDIERIRKRASQEIAKGVSRLFDAVVDSALEQVGEVLDEVKNRTGDALDGVQDRVTRTRKKVRRPRPPR